MLQNEIQNEIKYDYVLFDIKGNREFIKFDKDNIAKFEIFEGIGIYIEYKTKNYRFFEFSSGFSDIEFNLIDNINNKTYFISKFEGGNQNRKFNINEHIVELKQAKEEVKNNVTN